MKKEFKMSACPLSTSCRTSWTYLKTTRAEEVAELIKEARGFGDLSENSEYDEAKNEQGKLYSRIAELEDILLHVVIIDESEGASNAVSIGCTVTVVDLKTGREMPPYKVVGSQEADRHAPRHQRGIPLRQGPHGCEGGRRDQRRGPRRHHSLPCGKDRAIRLEDDS